MGASCAALRSSSRRMSTGGPVSPTITHPPGQYGVCAGAPLCAGVAPLRGSVPQEPGVIGPGPAVHQPRARRGEPFLARVGRPRPGPVGVAEDHVSAAQIQARRHLTHSLKARARKRRPGEIRAQRAQAGSVQRRYGGGERGAKHPGAGRAARARPRAQGAPGADGDLSVAQVVAGAELGSGGYPGEQRAHHRLVVLRSAQAIRRGPEHPGHGADRQPLDRGNGQVAVEVVPMRRIDIATHPQTRIGAGDPRRGGPFGEPGQRR